VQESIFTPAARRHIASLLKELAPHAAQLNRQCKAALRAEDFDREQARALLALAPQSAGTVGQLLKRTVEQARRLARQNVPLEQIGGLLNRFDALAGKALRGRFAPSREQILLATAHILNASFYEVREAEAQAFFGLYRAETEAAGLDDLLRRFAGVLTRTFGAQSGRIVIEAARAPQAPQFIACGSAAESRIADGALRRRQGCYWSFPLASQGAIQLAFDTSRRWLPRERTLLEAVAARCQEAIARASAAAAMRRLEAQALAAEEQERRRIGRELHDEAGQSLMLLRLRLEMLERVAPEPLRAGLAEARGIVDGTIGEVRRIVAALGPAVLERLGLVPALRQLGARFQKNQPAQLRLRIALNGHQLPMCQQEVIYRVAQESLSNAAKHSGARHVNLSLLAADKRVRLSVTDDGAGFNAETAWRKPMSFGLAGMRERAALLGGTLTVRSAPAKGAIVILELPNGEDSRSAH
jgi:signal transduction histidine kinase